MTPCTDEATDCTVFRFALPAWRKRRAGLVALRRAPESGVRCENVCREGDRAGRRYPATASGQEGSALLVTFGLALAIIFLVL
ncbi:hypothetical protein JTL51_34065, partial [Pseudomonas aeruginosa]|nr:hypothetical protein [Pseudomonas aeruginosa]